jgi:hypothetical protein
MDGDGREVVAASNVIRSSECFSSTVLRYILDTASLSVVYRGWCSRLSWKSDKETMLEFRFDSEARSFLDTVIACATR